MALVAGKICLVAVRVKSTLATEEENCLRASK